MNPIHQFVVVVAMAFTFSSVAVAAEGKASAPVAKKPVRTQNQAAARGEARASPADGADGANPASSIGQVVYQVLLGEMALQRGNLELGVDAYADLAVRTRDPKVISRATELASQARRLDLASELAKLWLEVEPDSMLAHQTLTAVLVLRGDGEALGPQISYLLENDKENLGDNLLRLNRMLSRYQDKAGVYRMLLGVLKPYENLPEAHYALATAAYVAGEQAAALGSIARALELRPGWDIAVLFEAQLLAVKSPEAGFQALERYLADHPGADDIRLHLARGLVAEKRYNEAQKHFQRLLATHPESPEFMYAVAVIALQQNDVATAEPLFKQVVTLGRGSSERAIAAYYLGQIAEDRKAYDEAASFYQQVTEGEQRVPAQIRLALLLLKQGKGLAQAQESLHESAKQSPAAADRFIIAEAEMLRDAGLLAEALALLDQFLAKQPDQPEVLYYAAMTAERMDRIDVAEAWLKRVIALQPDNAHAYNALGYSLADRNLRLDEARTLIERAHALAPKDPAILDSMGWVLYRQGKSAEALTYLQQAYALQNDAEIAAHLLEVLWQLGRQDEARSFWDAATKSHPGNTVLEGVRRKLWP